MILFSIIIPVYNVEHLLEKCVDSVLNQEFDRYEIILVNDGSTDNSLEICNNIANKNYKVRVANKKNGGASSARNLGILKAKGDYLMFLDSDDYWDDINALSAVSNKLKVIPSIDMLLFGAKTFNTVSKSNKIRCNFSESDILYLDENDFSSNISYLQNRALFPTSAWSIVIRKSILTDNSISFKEGIVAEDIDWMVSIMKQEPKISAIENNFYRYHKLQIGSVTSTSGEKSIKGLLYAFDKWTTKLNPNIPSDLTLLKFLSHHFATAFLTYAKLDKNQKMKYRISLMKHFALFEYSRNSLKSKIMENLIKFFGIERGSKLAVFIYSLYLRF